MRQRIPGLFWCISSIAAVATWIAPAALHAQPVTPTRPTAVEQVSTAADALPTGITSALEHGRTLESAGRWPEALSYYEETLHEHPEDPALQDRFDIARMHYSLEQRYSDHSFRDSLNTLRPQQALDLYNDMLGKIEAHYYTTPPWQLLVQRGAMAVDIALTSEAFLKANAISARGPQLEQARNEVNQLSAKYAVRNAQDTSAVASQIAKLANQRLGLSESATLLEFTSSAAGNLDHYSGFLTADQLRDIYSQIEGNFVGLGVELKADNGALLIVDVIPHSPAEKAGILADDHIVAVDGQATRDMSTDEAASMLTGVEGSSVRVSVVTPGQAPRELTIKRANVDVPSLEGVKILDPATGVAYVKIPAFQKTTAQDLEAALWDLHRQGMRSLVIDLRGNPGGLLTASVEVADKFIANGGIVSTRGRSEQENFNYRAHRPGTWRVPLAVLIDGDSASASEIFAGAIKDSGRGVLVGSRSYGKGSVQGIFPLGAGGAGVRITTARFYSPLGHPISNVGVTPDIDARRATAVAQGEQPEVTADNKAHLVGFRGAKDTSTDNDPALEMAVQAAQSQPVAQL